MRIGQIFRYARPYNPKAEIIDGLPNYFYHTFTEEQRLPLLDSGINPIQKIKAVDGLRCPAILISSSPHKIGSIVKDLGSGLEISLLLTVEVVKEIDNFFKNSTSGLNVNLIIGRSDIII